MTRRGDRVSAWDQSATYSVESIDQNQKLSPARNQLRKICLDQMRNRQTFFTIVGVLTIGHLIGGCATVGENSAEIATSRKEMLLTDAGFRARTVTSPQQQEQVSRLAANKVSAVKHNGRLYYVYPTIRKDQILVGNQAQFEAYKAGLQSSRSSQGTNPQAGDPFWVEETAGPNNVAIETFEAVGPGATY
jgi:hypothetical protein